VEEKERSYEQPTFWVLIDFVGLVTTEAGVEHDVEGVGGAFASEEWLGTSFTGDVGWCEVGGMRNGPGREYDDLCRPNTFRQWFGSSFQEAQRSTFVS
jgi:hypothetical protein